MNTNHIQTQAIFAYGSLSERLLGVPAKLYGYRVWWRGWPSLKPQENAVTMGIVYDIPVDLLDRMDVESQKFGDYHRFKIQVFDGMRYRDCWTYQMTCDADAYTRATSFTLSKEDTHVPVTADSE